MMRVLTIHSAIGDVEPGASPVITAPTNGRIADITVTSGSAVTAGQILAQLRPAGATAAPRQSLIIRAPVNATVTRVFAQDGQRLQNGQRLFGLAGAAIRQGRAPFPAALRPPLIVGQRVLLHSPLAPRSPLTGIIARLTPAKRTRHAIYAWITLPPRPGFTVGSPLRVDVRAGMMDRLLVPPGAVFLRRAGTVVFVVRRHHVHEQRVRATRVLPQGVVIRSGLRPGVSVVTYAHTPLTRGMRVRIVARAHQ
jgi:multidrug efflux pump subunit AcrA (membrane-fusion protein)